MQVEPSPPHERHASEPFYTSESKSSYLSKKKGKNMRVSSALLPALALLALLPAQSRATISQRELRGIFLHHQEYCRERAVRKTMPSVQSNVSSRRTSSKRSIGVGPRKLCVSVAMPRNKPGPSPSWYASLLQPFHSGSPGAPTVASPKYFGTLSAPNVILPNTLDPPLRHQTL